MPYFPLFGIMVNYFLVAQLAWWGILLIFGYIGLAVLFYFCYGVQNSVGNANGWAKLLKMNGVSAQAPLLSHSPDI